MAYLIKRSSNDEIDITDGVSGRMALAAAVWQEWVKILGVAAPGYIIVSDALWYSLPVITPASAPPAPAPPPPAPAPPPSSAYPTAATTGVPAGTAMTTRTDVWRTSQATATTETINGKSYRVITAYDFRAAGQYMAVDNPYVAFRKCKFSATGAISNTMSLVQLQPGCLAVLVEDCEFDGGPIHNRCLWGDAGDIVVRRSKFTRFGNSAVEKNDRTGTFSMDVQDCYLDEVKGWPPADHTDGLQMGGGKSFTAVHNSISVEPYNGTDGDTSNVSNSCIGMWAELGDVTGDVLIQNNLLAGGGSVIYCEQKAPYAFRGHCTVQGNVFDRKRYPSLKNTASVWFILAPVGLPAGFVWASNVYESGAPVTQATAMQATQ